MQASFRAVPGQLAQARFPVSSTQFRLFEQVCPVSSTQFRLFEQVCFEPLPTFSPSGVSTMVQRKVHPERATFQKA